MFYLYLFNKYSSKCLVSGRDKHHIGIVFYLKPNMSSEDNENLENEIKEGVEELKNCIKKDIDVLVIPLTIVFADFNSAHANILIYRRSEGTIEHFEPHGSQFSFSKIENVNEIIHTSLEKFMKTLNETLVKNNIEPKKLVHSNEVCPMIYGLQGLESTSHVPKQPREGGGYCAAWSLFFAELAPRGVNTYLLIHPNQFLT